MAEKTRAEDNLTELEEFRAETRRLKAETKRLEAQGPWPMMALGAGWCLAVVIVVELIG